MLRNSVTICLLLLILPTLLWTHPDEAAPVPVRFVEGAVHGFLTLSEMNGNVIAAADLRQVSTAKGIEARTIFHFKDGSLSDETVVYTEQNVFSMQSYHAMQRGPAFAEDRDVYLERSGKYRVKNKDHKEDKEQIIDGMLDLPPDVYNGMIFTIAKNLPEAERKTVHIVAFTPEPRIIGIDITPAGEEKVSVSGSGRSATHFVMHPQLGRWLQFFAKLTGQTPPDEHVWILSDSVPAFVKFEGPLYVRGPVWRIELTSPRSIK